jgi:hypothetical protein
MSRAQRQGQTREVELQTYRQKGGAGSPLSLIGGVVEWPPSNTKQNVTKLQQVTEGFACVDASRRRLGLQHPALQYEEMQPQTQAGPIRVGPWFE